MTAQPPQQQQQQPPAPAMAPAMAPVAPGTTPVPAAGPPPVGRAWHITKIVLGSASLVFSIILVALSAASWTLSDGYAYELVWVIPVAGVAICWQVAEFITICARTGHKSIHPGAHVALHLLLWLGFLVNVILDGFNAGYLAEYLSDYDDYGYSPSSYYYGYYNFMISGQYQSITYALLAFSALLLIIHFTLFVRACIETHKRNSADRAVRYIYVQQPMYYPGQQFTPQQLMQMQMQQQQFYGQPQPQQPVVPGGIQQPQPAHYSGYYSDYYDPQQQQQGQQQGTKEAVQPHATGSTSNGQAAGPSGSASDGRGSYVEAPQPVYNQQQHA
ncbi:uncharacterized protein B0I36DRAFT_357011 [Microdochium trichocladiopsis]|uniref:MARVEL domain-containing protein n=1 Tax=Microdochium trichocladiopsis TaxID=1682393 RepID=A0A9P8YGP7_9PEZI|nr:uncharacterized protein B0I36DRAFT_357011 [Microdochium trichocladiopsis]KAH7039603.1 hypothetical protein B0I36DRAFT_357011 [Microdochium trichocladiopsis]